ncbi:MAG: MFS transporter [Desulfitobacteriaceae bacterium]
MKIRWWVAVVLFLTWLMSYIDRTLMPMALPFIGKEFNLNPTVMGIVISSFFIGYGLMQIPGGMIADKFGPRKVITLGVTFWSVFSILTGMANGLTSMIWTRIFFGVGEGMHPPGSWKMISTWFKPVERARANSLMMASNMVGPALAPIFFAAVMGAFGWRQAFYLLSIPGFLIAFIAYWYLRDKPVEHPKVTREELTEIGTDDESRSNGKMQEKIPFSELLKYKPLWQLFFIYMTWDVTWWGFLSWLPTYLYTARGFTLMKTGVIAALPFVAGLIGMLIAGYISDKIKRRKVVLIPVLLGDALFMLLTATAPNSTMAIIYLTATGFFLSSLYGPFWALPMDLLPARVMGYSSGFINFGGQIAGFTAPIIIGVLVQKTGNFAAGFVFMAIAATVSAIIVATLKEPQKDVPNTSGISA